MRHLSVLCGAAAAVLASCTTPQTPTVYTQEKFETTTAFSRTYESSPVITCEAARRALLSQGYVVLTPAGAEVLQGRKKFQHDPGTHVEIEFNVVCAPNGSNGESIAFVSALQDHYALKKSPSSASVGVGAFGSVSLPFAQSDDAMVKIASQTIAANDFYSRFFDLVAYYLGRPGQSGGPGVLTPPAAAAPKADQQAGN